MSKAKPLNVTEDALAKHWGVSTRYVRMMAEEDVAVRTEGRSYDLLESDRRLIAWHRRDEPMQRMRRESVRAQIQHREQKMQIEQRKLLQPDEVREYVDRAWGILWTEHTAALNRWYSEVLSLQGEDAAIRVVGRLSEDVKGELRKAKSSLESLHGARLAEMDCELRNGLIVKTREIERIKAALCESDDE